MKCELNYSTSRKPVELPLAQRPNISTHAAFIGGAVFTNESFGPHHPLSIPRHSATLELCRFLGWLDAQHYHESPQADEDTLSRFHHADYIQALRSASERGAVSIQERERYNIGNMENPLFTGLYQRAASCVGGSILAAKLALDGQVAFHPAGGTHHGRPGQASGFCYFNDPVFAIMTLLDAPLDKVMYIDLDAHHGDGVQNAFEQNERVLCLSIHEQNRWPYSGAVNDRAAGGARNLPVPAGFNDSELAYLMENAVLPLLHDFAPEALVITCGADGLHGDPLSKMELSNVALWQAVEDLLSVCPRAVVLGGGGYNPWTVARCWSGLWGQLDGKVIPTELPPAALDMLGSFESDLIDPEDVEPEWLNSLADTPRTGPVSDEVRQLARQVMEDH